MLSLSNTQLRYVLEVDSRGRSAGGVSGRVFARRALSVVLLESSLHRYDDAAAGLPPPAAPPRGVQAWLCAQRCVLRLRRRWTGKGPGKRPAPATGRLCAQTARLTRLPSAYRRSPPPLPPPPRRSRRLDPSVAPRCALYPVSALTVVFLTRLPPHRPLAGQDPAPRVLLVQ